MALNNTSPAATTAVVAVLTAICTIAVALRFLSRKVSAIKPGIEDWFVLSALALTIIMATIEFIGVHQHVMGVLTPPNPKNDPTFPHRMSLNLKYIWIIQMLGVPQIGLVKLSFAFFYRRVFSVQKNSLFTILNTALIVLILVWTLGFWLALLFACKGHFTAWWAGNTENEKKYCISDPMYSSGLTISDIIIDGFIIIMPMPMVWRLHMNRARKGLVTGVFFLGAVAVVSSIIRAVFFWEVKYASQKPHTDHMVNNSEIMLWTIIESCLGLTAACLPLLYGLVVRTSLEGIARSVRSIISLESFRSTQSHDSNARRSATRTEGVPDNAPYVRTGSLSNSQTIELVPGNAGTSWSASAERKSVSITSEDYNTNEDLESGIRVQKKVEQSSVSN